MTWERIVPLSIQHTPVGGYAIDIGVHQGQELFPIADHIGPTGHIWGFEPNPQLVQFVQNWALREQRSNITIVNKGVYDRTDVLDFYYSTANYALSNTFEPALVEDHNIRFPHIFTDKSTRIIKVPTVSLDDFFPHQKIDFIKCDAQGAEPKIIKGGEKLIRTHRPAMIFEWEKSITDQESVEVYHFLTGLGYKLSRITNNGLIEIQKPEDMFCSIHIMFDILCLPG